MAYGHVPVRPSPAPERNHLAPKGAGASTQRTAWVLGSGAIILKVKSRGSLEADLGILSRIRWISSSSIESDRSELMAEAKRQRLDQLDDMLKLPLAGLSSASTTHGVASAIGWHSVSGTESSCLSSRRNCAPLMRTPPHLNSTSHQGCFKHPENLRRP